MLFYLTCCYLLVFYIQPGGRIPALGAIRFELLLGGAILITLFVLRPRYIFTKERMSRAAVVFFAGMTLSFIGAIQTHTASDAFPVFIKVLKFFSIYIMIIGTVDSKKKLERFVWVYVLCLLILVGEPFLLSLQGKNFSVGEGGILRLYGVGQFAHPNGLGTNAVTLLTLLYFLFWHYRSYIVKSFLAGFGLISLRVIMLTASRTAYLGLLILLFYLFLFSKRKLRFLVISCLLVTILYISVPSMYKKRFISLREVTSAVGSEERQLGSIGYRWAGIIDSWDVFLEYPIFGCGMETFMRIHPGERTFGTKGQVHSLLLEILAETGLVGLASFSFLIIVLWKALSETKAKIIALSGESSFLYILMNLLQTILLTKLTLGVAAQQILYSNIWWIIGGLGLVSSRILEKQAEGNTSSEMEPEMQLPDPAFNR